MKWHLWGATCALAVIGVVVASRHPFVGAPMVLLAGVSTALMLRGWILGRRVAAAARQCDLPRLEQLTLHDGPLSRAAAWFTYMHHGGFADERLTRGRCTCGKCEKDVLDEEIRAQCRRLAQGWSGAASYAALDRVTEGLPEGIDRPLRESVLHWRVMTHLLLSDLFEQPRPEGLTNEALERDMPTLRWPLRLARARVAFRGGDRAEARAMLVGMPGWPEGTPLEVIRREIEAGTSGASRCP